MESIIASRLHLRYQPVAVIFSDTRPQQAVQFKEGRWGCVISMLTAAAKGKTVVFDRQTVGCYGAERGLGFGSDYQADRDWLVYFLSTGKPGEFEGEGYKKTPELASQMIDSRFTADMPYKYVIFKPLKDVDIKKEQPELVIFYVTPDQLSALVVLANYSRTSNDNVIVNMGSGCSTICQLPYRESRKEIPRAVIGLTDVTVRPHVDPDILSFTVPYKMFLVMEKDVPDSFLDRPALKKVSKRIEGTAKNPKSGQ